MPIQKFEICAPLQEFCWTGDNFELGPGLWIRRQADIPDLQRWNERLSDDEQTTLSSAGHWLIFGWTEGTDRSPGEIVNLVLLSLWMAKPTKTHVAFRFKLGPDPTTSGAGRARLLDRFQWIPNSTEAAFDTEDLQIAARYFWALAGVDADGRVNDALRLTLSGCVARQWQAQLVCYAAAAETLLTYDTVPGLVRRLARVYACLVESEPTRRDIAFDQFRALYAIRSDIVHGRTGRIALAERLPKLADFAEMMRVLWRAAIRSAEVVEILEGTDQQRRDHFHRLCSGYDPPR